MMQVSVVVPVYNEAANVPLLADELGRLRERLPELEVLMVDDGSSDETWSAIQEASANHDGLRGIRHTRNRGQTAAMLTGIHAARGEAIALIDGDLQNDPADIPLLLEKLGDADVVCGYRAKRQDTWSRRAGSKLANRIRNWVTRDGIRDTGCSLKVFRREAIGDIPPLDGAHRFLPAYFKLHGRRLAEVAVNHRARRYGDSKYTNLKRLPRTIADLFGFWSYRRRFLGEALKDDAVQP